MTSVRIEGFGFDALVKTLEGVSEKIEKELNAVTGRVSTKGKSIFAKEVSSNIAISQKDVKPHITIQRLKPAGAIITLEKSNRFSLKRFKPRQTKKGVTYKIDKKGPRKTIVGGFMGPNPNATSLKLRGHVFARAGKTRLPIVKRRGPSAAGAIDNHPSRIKSIKRQLSREVRKQLVRRIKYRRLKIAGTI